MLQMITLILQNPGQLSVKNLGFRARLYSIEEKMSVLMKSRQIVVVIL